ncbi:primosomal protein [Kineosporia babensis]|uniref:Primosomal protein n=1 Tax=Kineosporia babensis TaxID=499548 RepID=A0A9X1NBZ1_9ACTN|nr:primosomal protein [Kineosporia babensis]MCD5312157.1 primosomal protein [Kineosporia babensis]
MTTEPRAALDRLIAALEAHLDAASKRAGEADPAVVAAYQTLADAFETYDESLYDAFDEVTPFVLYDDAEDALAGEDDEDDDLEDLDDDLDDFDDDEDEDDSEDGAGERDGNAPAAAVRRP